MANVIAIVCMIAMPLIVGYVLGYYKGREKIINDFQLRYISKGDFNNAVSVITKGYWQK